MFSPDCARLFNGLTRLIKSSTLTRLERRALIRDIASRISEALGAVKFAFRIVGIEERCNFQENRKSSLELKKLT